MHTSRGLEYLANFVFGVCGCVKDWDARHRVPLIEQEIRDCAGSRNVFFFVSGGVDSSVAFALCTRALGAGRVRGVYVDTGLMREGETDFVRRMPGISVEHAEDQFLGALAGVTDPEQKRHIIGEEFVRVQERIVESRHLLDEHWILGQGTIYPDTIESGGTAKAAVIKTHHNRVAGIQKLIECGRIVEPLKSFYKDEVREMGRELELPAELLDRHPFPGPGLAIRCLCSEFDAPVRATEDGYILPVNSVGVQGDARTYAPVLAIDALDHARATALINRLSGVNRVVTAIGLKRASSPQMQVRACGLTPRRIELLRRADAIVRRLSHESRLRPPHLAVSGDSDSAGNRGRPGIGGAAARRFGGRHDRAVGGDGGVAARPDLFRVTRAGWHCGRVLRPHAQAARHHRMGIEFTSPAAVSLAGRNPDSTCR